MKLAGAKVDGGYRFRTNEGAADAAEAIVADWLRSEAEEPAKITGESP